MNSEQNNDINQGKSANSSRRKFLQKTSAGVVIASIPSKSVWANTGGLINSIQASNHGSGWNGENALALLSQGYWCNPHGGPEASKFLFQGTSFDGKQVFGSTAYPRIKSAKYRWNNGDLEQNTANGSQSANWVKASGVLVRDNPAELITLSNITLYYVVSKNNIFENTSIQICAMYLNAFYSPQFGLNFPVFDGLNGKTAQYATYSAFGEALYSNIDNSSFGDELSDLICRNHVPSNSSNSETC